MSHGDLWEKLWKRFDPERPAESAWRAERPHSPVQYISQVLDRPFDTPRVLLVGTVGTGKTTELQRVAEARDGREIVVFLDLAHHFTEVVKDAAALDRIHSWEVCFLAGLALVGTMQKRLKHEFPQKDVEALLQAWNTLAKDTGTTATQLDMPSLIKSATELAALGASATMGGVAGQALSAGLKWAGSAASAIRQWAVPLGRGKEALPDQDSRIQVLMDAINVLIGETQSLHRRVLFVIDGLDRIRDVHRARELFIDSRLISQLDCPVVVCGPFALRHHPSTAAVRGFDVAVLVNEPVLLQEDPRRWGSGVAFFRELFERRVADLGPAALELVSRPLLEELAYRSGGRARDFVKFIRELAGLAYDSKAPQADEALVQQVLDRQRRGRELGLRKDHIQLLEEVAADPEHRLPAPEKLVQELLDSQHLLPYPDGSEWYYPHPLLTMRLLRTPEPGSTP